MNPRPDAERLRLALDRWFRLVWRTLRGLGVPAADADDAAQRVFGTFAAKLSQVESGRERAFLLAASVRVAANARRSLARRLEEVAADLDHVQAANYNPEDLVMRKQARHTLEQILSSMPAAQRTVFVLFELEGLSLTEISHDLAIPRGTVASRLRAARAVFDSEAERRRQFKGGQR